MTDHFVTNAGKAGRRSAASEQQAFALEAARLERKAIRRRLVKERGKKHAIRKALTRTYGVVFLDAEPNYGQRRAALAARRKGEVRKWNREYRALTQKWGIVKKRAAEAAERAELERRRIVHLMHSAPGASASHRGTKSTYNTSDRDAVRREPDAPRERVTDGKRHPVRVARVSDSGRMRP